MPAMYRKNSKTGKFERWTGGVIAGIKYPASIEDRWNLVDLAAIGIFPAIAADPIPAGMQVASQDIIDEGGRPKIRYQLEPIPVETAADIIARRQRIAQDILDRDGHDRGIILALFKMINDLTASLNEARDQLGLPTIPVKSPAELRAEIQKAAIR